MDDSATPVPRVILLNGRPSTSKTELARALQQELAGDWLRLGSDTLLRAAPPRLLERAGQVDEPAGEATRDPAFDALEAHWRRGIAAIAASGGQVLVEDTFVSGPAAQQSWRIALEGIPTAWIGVRSPSALAAAREFQRGKQTGRSATPRDESVHRGISYDLTVDTSVAAAADTASLIRERLGLGRAAT